MGRGRSGSVGGGDGAGQGPSKGVVVVVGREGGGKWARGGGRRGRRV